MMPQACVLAAVFAFGVARATSTSGGDEAFARAYEAALVDLVLDGTMETLVTKNDVMGFVQVMDCAPDGEIYSYPSVDLSAGGTLAEVLERGYARVGARRGFTSSGWADYNDPPKGMAPDVEKEVFRRIGLHYGRNLTVRYNLNFSSTDAVIAALDDNVVDASACNYGIGSFSGNVRRATTYRYSCCTTSEDVYMASSVSSGITSKSDLELRISQTNLKGQAKVGAVGTSAFQVIQQLFLTAVVVQYTTDVEAIAALANDISLLAVAAFKPASKPDTTNNWYSINFVIPRTSFFRKEILLKNKVANISKVTEWQTGNQALASVYNAALVWTATLGLRSDIYSRYNISLLGIGDCVTKEGSYTVPSGTSGTLKQVLDSHKLRIGVMRTESLPLIDSTGDSPVGALPDVERSIATWISRQYSSFLPVSTQYTLYDTSDEVFDALGDGSIDVTTAFMFAGGFYSNEARRRNFFPSCYTTATFMIGFASNTRDIHKDLAHYLSLHPGLALGGVGMGNVQILKTFYGNLAEIVYFQKTSTAFAAVVSNQSMVAILTDWMSEPPDGYAANVTQFELPFISPSCAFFRQDIVGGCGDGIVDQSLGEECDSSAGCADNCQCGSGYGVDDRTHECHKNNKKTYTAAIVGGVLGGLVMAVVVVAVVMLVILIPILRHKYRKEGAIAMRFAIFRPRSSLH
eukprot:TRINITY_DN2777_c0_g1_i6.p1 TRINITY_DN2777_c0_g1~~TRINITY_DN2777_c0_g1_i6.p1  ORF type:complete len:700 (+),score=95.79 TRINITY_DN2777_c0_g1_i6:34-2100(+)